MNERKFMKEMTLRLEMYDRMLKCCTRKAMFACKTPCKICNIMRDVLCESCPINNACGEEIQYVAQYGHGYDMKQVPIAERKEAIREHVRNLLEDLDAAGYEYA